MSTFLLEKYRKKTDTNLLISYWKHGMYHSIIKFDFYTTSENRNNYMHIRGKTTKSWNVNLSKVIGSLTFKQFFFLFQIPYSFQYTVLFNYNNMGKAKEKKERGTEGREEGRCREQQF